MLTYADVCRNLVEVFEECVKAIKPGVPMRKIYEVASTQFEERDPKARATHSVSC